MECLKRNVERYFLKGIVNDQCTKTKLNKLIKTNSRASAEPIYFFNSNPNNLEYRENKSNS